jgi:hypothetical protein
LGPNNRRACVPTSAWRNSCGGEAQASESRRADVVT